MNRQGKIRKSLVFSFWDGVFASCTVGLTADYVAPYALALKATTTQIAFLTALPNLAASLVQLKSADFTERMRSRRRVIVLFVLLQALMVIPIILIPHVFTRQPVFSLLVFVMMFTGFNAFAGPPWSSLMSDHIPHKSRGAYFSWRSRILGVVTVVSGFLAGAVLHYFRGNALRGFLVIFSAAFVCRMISWGFVSRMYEPPFVSSRGDVFSFWDFIRRVRESNFARFVLLVSALHLCVNLAAPFFSVFMLEDLKFSYMTYTILMITVTVAQVLTLNRWGRHADKVGNIKVLKFTAFCIAGLPLWWFFSHNPVYLVVVQFISGFAWAGFNLCVTNFIYDAVTPRKRTRCIAYFNVCSGLAVCIGALSGGYMANRVPDVFGYPVMTLFLVSSLLRFAVAAFFCVMVKEVRPAARISSMDLFYSVIGIKPMPGPAEESPRGEE